MNQSEAFDKLRAEFDLIHAQISRDYGRAVESLTKDQFISALTQAIKCGDFLRYITAPDGNQQVQEQSLRANIAQLLEELEACKQASAGAPSRINCKVCHSTLLVLVRRQTGDFYHCNHCGSEVLTHLFQQP